MKPTKLFLASAFITALILIVIGAMASTVMANQAASQVPGQNSEVEVQAIEDREAAYKQMIEQANQQLEKANSDLLAMQEQINLLQPQVNTNQPSAAPETAISVKQAGDIAAKTAEIALKPLRDPELVIFEGRTAYEIAYEVGSIFVDAQTGEILLNGTAPLEVSADQAAQIAADYLKNNAILQVDEIPFRGAQIYRVIFKDGTFAFLDKTGQITYIQAPGPRAESPQISYDTGGGGDDHGDEDHSSSEHEDDEHEDEDHD